MNRLVALVLCVGVIGGVIATGAFIASPAPVPDVEDYTRVLPPHEPPPGFPPNQPEGGYEGDADTEEWMGEEHDINDTALYVFQLPYTKQNPHCGNQNFGTINKIGIRHPITVAFPNRNADYIHIRDQATARVAWLSQNGQGNPDPASTWFVVVDETKTVGTENRYIVAALYGQDSNEASQSSAPMEAEAEMFELWRIEVAGTPPTLLERTSESDMYIDGKTVAERGAG